ncbi:MAG: MFS transporter [Alphaproteobacteria bacterium]|nr:MFS transporter [Alphaproteobacteria bacterium SS10]
MSGFSTLALILISAALVAGGNGLSLTLTSVGGISAGYDATLIGLMGTAYYSGQFISAFVIPPMFKYSGHIRIFAGLASCGAISLMVMALSDSPIMWAAMRVVAGVAVGGIAMTIESWMMGAVTPGKRGRLMSIYRIADLGSITGVQFLLPIFGTTGANIFIINAMLFSLALVPLALSRLINPPAPEVAMVTPGWLWKLSPVAITGVAVVALVNGAFRTVGPLYAEAIGLGAAGIASFISAAILAGAIFQYPLGWYSDRGDRRNVLLFATAGAGIASITMSFVSAEWALIAVFFFGGFAMPLYPLSVAHAYDFAKPEDYIRLSAGFILVFSAMAAIGPLIAAGLINMFGPHVFFIYTGVLHLFFIAFVVARMRVRDAVPVFLRQRFVALMRNSPMIGHFVNRGDDKTADSEVMADTMPAGADQAGWSPDMPDRRQGPRRESDRLSPEGQGGRRASDQPGPVTEGDGG